MLYVFVKSTFSCQRDHEAAIRISLSANKAVGRIVKVGIKFEGSTKKSILLSSTIHDGQVNKLVDLE